MRDLLKYFDVYLLYINWASSLHWIHFLFIVDFFLFNNGHWCQIFIKKDNSSPFDLYRYDLTFILQIKTFRFNISDTWFSEIKSVSDMDLLATFRIQWNSHADHANEKSRNLIHFNFLNPYLFKYTYLFDIHPNYLTFCG